MGPKKRRKANDESKTPDVAPSPALQELTDEETLVLEYMVQQNRPYSALNVSDNLRGAVKKAQVTKVLDHLAELGKVQAKDFGKARVYLVDQKSLPTSTDEELAQLDTAIKDKQAAVDLLNDEVKQLKDQLKERNRLMTAAQLQAEIERLTTLNAEQQRELEASEGVTPVSDEERAVVEKRLLTMTSAAKTRQRLCMSIVYTLSEMMELKPKGVMEKLGMELP
jgi:26S proteasome regulatory subunit (ATPase 3-interacting protein)